MQNYERMTYMSSLVLLCPSCKKENLRKSSERQGREFYTCTKPSCPQNEFRLEYIYEEPPQAETVDEQPKCPSCEGDDIRKFGKKQGTQIYRCNNGGCTRTTFRQQYTYKAWDPKVKDRISELSAEGNSARAIGRMLSVSKDTVLKVKEENQ